MLCSCSVGCYPAEHIFWRCVCGLLHRTRTPVLQTATLQDSVPHGTHVRSATPLTRPSDCGHFARKLSIDITFFPVECKKALDGNSSPRLFLQLIGPADGTAMPPAAGNSISIQICQQPTIISFFTVAPVVHRIHPASSKMIVHPFQPYCTIKVQELSRRIFLLHIFWFVALECILWIGRRMIL